MNRAEEMDLLSALGYMVFERDREGTFRACGELPGWVRRLSREDQLGNSVISAFAFLEVFLLDAEQFWANPADRTIIHSDYWIQADLQGDEHCLRAWAVLLRKPSDAPRRMMLIESADQGFQETQ